MALLKQNTARTRVFSFIGVSLTVLTVTISKNGAAFGALAGTSAVVSGETKYYKVALAAGDVDTLGDLAYKFSDSVLGLVIPDGGDVDQVVTDLPGAKVAVTLAAADVSGNLPASLVAAGVDNVSIAAGSPTLNLRQAVALILAFAAGKMTDLDLDAPKFAAAGAASTNRINSVTDATGRSSVVLNPPA